VRNALTLLLLVIVISAAFGLYRRLRDGRVRVHVQGSAAATERLAAADIGSDLGSDATFVQFSSAFCQPCRATRVLLEGVTRDRPGVAHVEIDAESNLELVRRFDVLRTPTVLVLDASGIVRGRASGVPKRDQILRTLDSLGSGYAG
jgi:thiol-disulfide isomerase/thioredoxin